MVKRQTAGQGSLAKLQHPARVMVTLGQFTNCREHADVVDLITDIGHERDDQRALVESVENLRRAHELPALPADVRSGRRRQRECSQPEAGARQLSVIGRRTAGGGLVLGVCLMRPVRSFHRPPKPVMGARERGRMDTHLLDTGKVRGRCAGVVEKTQRDPPRHEMALDSRVLFCRLGSIADHQVCGSVIAAIQELARQDAALNPPFLRIVHVRSIVRGGEHRLRRFGDLVLMPEKMHAREDVAGILVGFGRYGIEQLGEVAALSVQRYVRASYGEIGAPEPMCCAHCSFVIGDKQSFFHSGLVVGAAQELGIALEHLALHVGGHPVVAPGFAHLRARCFGVSLRDERACEDKPAFGGLRRGVLEKAQDLRGFHVLVPKHLLRVAVEDCEARPGRVGGNEGKVAAASGAAVVAAQDHPFDQLARSGIGDAGLDLGCLAGAASAQAVDCFPDQRDIGIGAFLG